MTDGFTNGYALLVGVNENAVARWALPDVVKDINALAAVLAHPQRCAYPAEHVKTIVGKEATRQGILNALVWLQERIQADPSGNATAVIYYSGHGWRDDAGAAYLIPGDVRETGFPARALRAEDFAAEVSALQPRRLLVILDCCHAGAMGVKDLSPLFPAGFTAAAVGPALLMGGAQALAFPGAKGLETLAQGQGRAVLSSSAGAQKSYMRKDGTMSIFTYHLIEALTGHAQPQDGSAAEVLVSDVMSHVYRCVPPSAQADWHEEQTPDYQMSGNFPVALLLGGQGLSKGLAAPDPLAPIADRGAPAPGYHIGGDYVAGDKVGGDKVAGDKIVIDRSVHDRHDVHIQAGGGVAYAPAGGIANVGHRNINVGGGVAGPIIMAEQGSTVNLGGARPGPAALPPSAYNLEAVRSLVTIALGDTELTTLACDHFPAAHESFGRGMGKDEKVQVLVEYCERYGRTGELLEQVRQRNPGQYAEYAPRLRRA